MPTISCTEFNRQLDESIERRESVDTVLAARAREHVCRMPRPVARRAGRRSRGGPMEEAGRRRPDSPIESWPTSRRKQPALTARVPLDAGGRAQRTLAEIMLLRGRGVVVIDHGCGDHGAGPLRVRDAANQPTAFATECDAARSRAKF